MNNDVVRKIKSQNGASLSWALLLFAVCAAVGSAVLTSGTAAAGRFKNLTETDQRYYLLSSAVDVFNETVDERTVEVERYKITNRIETYDNDGGLLSRNETKSYYTKLENADLTNSTDLNEKRKDIVFNITLNKLFGANQNADYYKSEDCWNRTPTDPMSISYFKMNISLPLGSQPLSCGDVLIKGYEAAGNSELVFDFGDVYKNSLGQDTLGYLFRLRYGISENRQTNPTSLVTSSVNGNVVTTVITERKVDKVRWSMISSEKY